MTEKPFPDSYWVVPGQFLAGAYPGSTMGDEAFTHSRLAAFLQAGFDTFIDLTWPGEAASYQEVLQEEAARVQVTPDYQRRPVMDKGLPSTEQMVNALNAIDKALAAGHKVYLHCLGGIGRTGTTVGCWLGRHGLTGEDALARLNSLYRDSEQSRFFKRAPEMDAQTLFILDWPEAASSRPARPAIRPENKKTGPDWHARFLQQAGWTRDLRSYLFEKTGLAQARRVLEVGCGTGAVLTGLSTRAAVHGLDLDPLRLAEARRHAVGAHLVCGDALHLPYPAGAFDLTFCHFLLLWLPDPLQALREMARLTRSGGHVLALAEPDYEARLDRPAPLARLGRWQTESLRRQGADPGLGRRLAELFTQAGLVVVETGQLEQGKGRPLTPEERRLEWAVLEADLAGRVKPAELKRLQLIDERAWETGQRRLSVPTYFAWGRVGPMV